MVGQLGPRSYKWNDPRASYAPKYSEHALPQSIGDLIHIKFEGEASTKSTKAFTEEAGKYIVKIKKKGYGKYVFNKEDVPKF